MSAVIYSDSKTTLVGGLTWSVISTDANTKERKKRLAELFTHKDDATHYAAHLTDKAHYAGLYVPSSIDKVQSKSFHSIALAFHDLLKADYIAEGVSLANLNAILLLKVGKSVKRCIVVIESGEIVWDDISEVSEATAHLERYKLEATKSNIPFEYYGDQSVDLTIDIQPLDVTTLAENSKKSSLLKSKPKNWILLLSLALLALLLLAGLAYYFLVFAPDAERKEKLQKEALQNKTPQYIVGVNALFEKAGWAFQDVRDHINAELQTVFYQNGWQLQSVDCLEKNSACVYINKRIGGIKDELKSSQKDKSDNKLALEVETATLHKNIKPKVTVIDRLNLRPKEDILAEYTKVTQRFINAKIATTIKALKQVDIAGIDSSKVKKEALVYEMPFEITYPYALNNNVFEELPKSYLIQQYTINANAANSKTSVLMVTLKGVEYAK